MSYDTNMPILLVDDFATMRRIIKNILRQLQFTNILEADDGATAWDLMQRQKVDFIISDWNMPQMTGLELLRKVRGDERFKSLPFLMVTAEAQQENILEAAQAGVSNYIIKPFTPEVLEQKIKKILQGK
ncbi:MAG: chemotaxis response regulator CheY [Desulfovibrionaceae bacterium]|nr:chemotaxis response regulator CheY [Desulfovibrionaceae bacterium]